MEPKILKSPLYALLRDEKPKEFNVARKGLEQIDLRSANLRGCDLRGAHFDGVDFGDAYFRSADLRGIDFTRCNLRGASLADAKVSGVLFPPELTSAEIRMSIELGTRLRY